jgi:RNA polymerase sigma factor FliA
VSPDELRMYKQSLPLLEEIVQWMSHRLGRLMPIDDVRAYAHDGLLRAVPGFDPARSSASTYFARKMRWAILDAVRREHRQYYLRSRAAAIMASERLSQDDEDRPDEPGSTEEHHVAALDHKLARHAAALVIGLVSGGSTLRNSEITPEEQTLQAQQVHVVRETIRTLPERERQLLERHYFDGEEFDAIAADLGISKSWASRLHAQAIETLSNAFREPFSAATSSTVVSLRR